MKSSRRNFLKRAGVAAGALGLGDRAALAASARPGSFLAKAPQMKLGTVTYNLAQDWDIETIIKNCSAAQFQE